MVCNHEVPISATNMYGGEKFAYADMLLDDYISSQKLDRKYTIYYDLGCKLKAYIPVLFLVIVNDRMHTVLHCGWLILNVLYLACMRMVIVTDVYVYSILIAMRDAVSLTGSNAKDSGLASVNRIINQ